MRVVFCGGGTGGHVYPAMTVAAALRRQQANAEPLHLLYIGVRGKIDRELVAREGIPFRAVNAGPLRVGDVMASVRGGLKLLAGAAEAFSILGRFRPDVVFATGGYGSVAVGLAARLRKLPLLLFLPDVAAGFAVKTLARVADRIAVTVRPAYDAMPPSKTVLTGYPVRPAFFEVERGEARARLGLHPFLPTLLVMGGSTGASVINEAVSGWAADFLRVGQLYHISGRIDEARLREQRAKLPPDLRERYHLHAYVHDDIALPFAAADLAVMRAGASTLGELPATRLPAVLIPGDFSDQRVNAQYLEREGAAVMLPQAALHELHDIVMKLLADSERRRMMGDALGALARPDAADELAQLASQMAGIRQKAAA